MHGKGEYGVPCWTSECIVMLKQILAWIAKGFVQSEF